MKIVMTFAVLFMTTAIFAQTTKSRKVGETMRVRSFHAIDKVIVREHAVGVVRMGDNSCGMYLEVLSEGGVVKLHPMNLPEEFKVEGKNVSFDFTKENVGLRDGCQIDSAVKLSNVLASAVVR